MYKIFKKEILNILEEYKGGFGRGKIMLCFWYLYI